MIAKDNDDIVDNDKDFGGNNSDGLNVSNDGSRCVGTRGQILVTDSRGHTGGM